MIRLPPRKLPETLLERPPVEHPFASAPLYEIALELRRYAGRYAKTEIQRTKFLDRVDELQAEAWALDRQRSRPR